MLTHAETWDGKISSSLQSIVIADQFVKISHKRCNSWPQSVSRFRNSSHPPVTTGQMRASSISGPSSSSSCYQNPISIDSEENESYITPLDYRSPSCNRRQTIVSTASTNGNQLEQSVDPHTGLRPSELQRMAESCWLFASPTTASSLATALASSGVLAASDRSEALSRIFANLQQQQQQGDIERGSGNDTTDGAQSATGEVENGFAAPAPAAASATTEDARMQANADALRQLVERRSEIYQFLRDNVTEYPVIHGLYVLLLAVLVLLILSTQFLVAHFGDCCTVLMAMMHYQDATRFMRSVSGASNIYAPLASVLLRNAFVLYVLDKRFLLHAIIFRDVISSLVAPDIFSVFYRVFVAEVFVMDVTLFAKMVLSKLPFVSKVYKRRVYQWMEYTSAAYRFPIPIVQWSVFIGSTPWVIVYGLAKLVVGVSIGWVWCRATVRLFRHSHLGTTPNGEELKNAEQCTICYSEFKAPIKLNCGHIFDSDCIRTWLDSKVTCPICRATVSKEDNHYRNGNSIFPMHIF